ncbi:hypothetical protein RHMOL_Rhmol09G0152100 [Rhododendron molle]|uniref:Uncharacterized protein n=1 Tax=Rhododendron molle TaxID=49168 RepID=A0ACC0MES5_RHOML|nr:hypothetical protein RHMOL_Rhmol09G0152100 [Rhododendron molle]
MGIIMAVMMVGLGGVGEGRSIVEKPLEKRDHALFRESNGGCSDTYGLVNLCRSDWSLSGGSNHRVAEEIRKAQPMCFVFNRAEVIEVPRLVVKAVHDKARAAFSTKRIATNNPAKSHHHTTRNGQAPRGKRPAISNKVERRSTTGSRKPAERDTPSRVSDGILPEGGGGGNEEGGGKGKREGGNNSLQKRGVPTREGEKKNEDKERRPGEEAAPPPQANNGG